MKLLVALYALALVVGLTLGGETIDNSKEVMTQCLHELEKVLLAKTERAGEYVYDIIDELRSKHPGQSFFSIMREERKSRAFSYDLAAIRDTPFCPMGYEDTIDETIMSLDCVKPYLESDPFNLKFKSRDFFELIIQNHVIEDRMSASTICRLITKKNQMEDYMAALREAQIDDYGVFDDEEDYARFVLNVQPKILGQI